MLKYHVISNSEKKQKTKRQYIYDRRISFDNQSANDIVVARSKNNCRNVLTSCADYIKHLKKQASKIPIITSRLTVLILNIDDLNGRYIIKTILPKYSCSKARKNQNSLFIRALFTKKTIYEAISSLDRDIAEKLNVMKKIAVVVVDHNTIEIYDA